jgi:OFA family oxalate/formate antiporter-like MFS transporter
LLIANCGSAAKSSFTNGLFAEIEEIMQKTKLTRLPRLLVGAAVLLFVGVIYAWSILKYPFEDVWEAGQLGFNFTVTVIFFCLGGLVAGLTSKKVPSTIRLKVAAVLLFLGFFLASFLIGSEGMDIILLYMTYGVLCGLGIGIVFNTVVSTVNLWFPDKMGLSSGLLMAGFGLSSLVLGNLINIMGHSELIGWQSTYVIIAIVLGIVLLAASFVIKPPPSPIRHCVPRAATPQNIRKPEGIAGQARKDGTEDIQSLDQDATVTKDYSAREMIRRPTFYKLFVLIFTLSALGSATVSFARDIALDVGATHGFAVTVVGLFALANGLGRPIVGWLYDRLGLRRTQYIVSITHVLAPLLIVISLLSGSLVLGVISLCLTGFVFCMAPLTGSVFVTRFYGSKNFPLNFGIVNLTLIPAPFAATMAGVIKDMTDEFVIAFVILIAVSLVGAIVNLTIKKP